MDPGRHLRFRSQCRRIRFLQHVLCRLRLQWRACSLFNMIFFSYWVGFGLAFVRAQSELQFGTAWSSALMHFNGAYRNAAASPFGKRFCCRPRYCSLAAANTAGSCAPRQCFFSTSCFLRDFSIIGFKQVQYPLISWIIFIIKPMFLLDGYFCARILLQPQLWNNAWCWMRFSLLRSSARRLSASQIFSKRHSVVKSLGGRVKIIPMLKTSY